MDIDSIFFKESIIKNVNLKIRTLDILYWFAPPTQKITFIKMQK